MSHTGAWDTKLGEKDSKIYVLMAEVNKIIIKEIIIFKIYI